MGDLDSLLQDFSYLKSLEHKNQVPKKLHRKLFLPDPSVSFVIEHVFRKTGEAQFERIYHRPLGQRCFQDFVFDEAYAKEDPCAKLLLKFTNDVKELYSDTPALALERARQIELEYFRNEALRGLPLLWKDADMLATFQRKMDKLEAKVQDARHHANIKEIYMPFVKDAKTYLSLRPWEEFKKSRFWIRYMQWKHLELNMKVTDADFDIHRILGRGGFGEVYGCRKHDTGAMFALKKLDKKRLKLKHQESSAVHERNVLAEMHSKFVTNLKYAFQDNDSLYIVLDLMEGGDLSWHLKKLGVFTVEQTRFYAAEIIMGLAHIHSRKMVYRDLKPANVLLDGQGHARISDLGLARDVSKSLPTSECGTHGYMAPEVLAPDVPYDTSADWWSLGCVVFQMLTGSTPFRPPGRKLGKEEVDQLTMQGIVEYPPDIPPAARDLIARLLTVDPKQRLGANGPSEIRAHEFFADIDWQALVDHKIKPAIRPVQGQVNAKDVYDIDRFDQHDTRRIVITREDNDKYYKSFDHIMSHQWQEEVLAVFPLVTATCDALEAKRAARIHRGGAPADSMAGAVFQGYLLKERGFLVRSWQRRFVVLYPDRIEWRMEQMHPVKMSILLTDIVSCTETTTRQTRLLRIATANKTFDFQAEHAIDHDAWFEVVHEYLEKLKTADTGARAEADPRANRISVLGDVVGVAPEEMQSIPDILE